MDNLRRPWRLELIENVPRARYYLRDRSNPLEDLQDIEFHQRFRFSKDTVLSILEMIRDDITPLSDRDANIPPMLKLLASLSFFATGSFQSVTGDLLNISQTSVSRILCNVSKAIAAHHHVHLLPFQQEMSFQLKSTSFHK